MFKQIMKTFKRLLLLPILLVACGASQNADAGVILSNNAPGSYDSNDGTLVFDILMASDDSSTVNVGGYR